MAQVKFYRGLKANYTSNQSEYANGLYFATDTEELLLDGKVYGNLSSLTVTAGESTDKIKLSYTTSATDANGHKTKTLSLDYTALMKFLTDGFIVGGNGIITTSYDAATKWTITVDVDSNGYLTFANGKLVIDSTKIEDAGSATGHNKLATKGYVDATAASASNGAFKGVSPTVSLTKQGETDTYSGTISFYDNADGTGNAVKTVAVSFDASDFVKDGILSDVKFFVDAETATTAGKTAPQGTVFPCLLFTFNTDANTQDIWVSVKDLVDTYTAGDGLELSNGEFSVKPKTGDYIVVDANGVALDSSKISHGSSESGTDTNLVTKKYVDDKAAAGLKWIDVPAGA